MAQTMMAKVIPELVDMQSLKEAQKKRQSVIFLQLPENVDIENPSKDSKYISNKASKAANQKSDKESNKPKIDGKGNLDDHFIDSAVNTKPKAQPQPKEESEAQSQPKDEPKSKSERQPKTIKSKSLDPIQISKPMDQPKPKVNPKPERKRFSSMAEARSMEMAKINSNKRNQDGGVKNRSLIDSLDVKQSPYGDYLGIFFSTIESHWDRHIGGVDFGRVVIQFKFWKNGNVTDVKVVSNSATSLLKMRCERSIENAAPFEPWPDGMREYEGDDYKSVTITFHYR